MSDNQEPETPELVEWRLKIEVANRNNVLCQCRTCKYEWVDSFENIPCPTCGGTDIQSILCWQFPDD